MQFRLSTILWATFVLAAAMGMAGLWGVPVAIHWIVMLWILAGRHARKEKGPLIAEACVGVVVFGLLIGMSLPAVTHVNLSARRRTCAYRLQQIGQALHSYRDKWNCWPPTVVRNSAGEPMHSWRTLILPHLNHAALYDAYDRTAAWNEGRNAALFDRQLVEYLCPSDPAGETPLSAQTSYVAVTGPGTAWDPAAATPPKPPAAPGAPAPRDARVLLIEIRRSNIAWAEPKDLTLEEVLAAADDGDSQTGRLNSAHEIGFNVLYADGSVLPVFGLHSRRWLELILTEDYETTKAQREQIEQELERELAPRRERQRQVRQQEADRRNLRAASTVLTFLIALTCYGVHVFRLRRRMHEEAAETASQQAETPPPNDKRNGLP